MDSNPPEAEIKPRRKPLFLTRHRLRNWLVYAAMLFGTPVDLSEGLRSLRWIIVGSGVLLIGAILHFVSKGFLERTQRLIIAGPYRFVRHPYYLANFIIDAGICVMAANPYLAAAYFILYVATYIRVIRREDQEMRELHGAAALEYQARVPAIVPWKWPAKATPGQGFLHRNLLRESEIPRVLALFTIPGVIWFFMMIQHDLRHHQNPITHFWQVKALLWIVFGGLELIAVALHRRARIIKETLDWDTPRSS